MINYRFVLCGCVLMAAMSVWAQESATKADTGSWIVGTRVTQFSLVDDTRGTPNHNSFMGSVTTLKEDQDNWPNKVFAQYRLVKSPFWIGVSYDHLNADAQDSGGTDGSVDLQGIIPYVQARWENDSRVVPYVEAGVAFYKADFDESEGWSNDGQRTVEIDDSVIGEEIAGGAAIRVYKNVSLDFYAQYMNVDDVTGTWSDFGQKFGDVIFTMSHWTYGIGAQVQF